MEACTSSVVEVADGLLLLALALALCPLVLGKVLAGAAEGGHALETGEAGDAVGALGVEGVGGGVGG